MIIVMGPTSTKENLEKVEKKITQAGLKYHLSTGDDRTIVGVIGDKKIIAGLQMNSLDGVEKTVRITEKYKLVSREFKPDDTIIDVGGVKIGAGHLTVMAGPCAVESMEQLMEAAECVKKYGAQFLRGGAFKPRTSPYDFQGLAEDGLKMLREAADQTGLKVVTEIVNINDVGIITKYADMIQIGARNMQNFQLLKEVGKVHAPVLLKRGLSATISEWLNAAEYIMAGGNDNVALCERGIRTYETYTRNTLDLSAVAAIKHLSHLPIIADPSHGTGKWRFVRPMAFASIAAGADGLIMEMHPNQAKALSEGPQSLTPESYYEVMRGVKKLAKFMQDEKIEPMDI